MYRDQNRRIYAAFSKVVPPDETITWEKLRNICEYQLNRRFANSADFANYASRLNYELSVIKEKHLSNNFLSLSNLLAAIDMGYIVGGPPINSLVSYLLSISSMDPVRYGLCFERYLIPGYETAMGWFILYLPENFVSTHEDSSFVKIFNNYNIELCDNSKEADIRIIESSAMQQIQENSSVQKECGENLNEHNEGFTPDLKVMNYIKTNFAKLADFLPDNKCKVDILKYPLKTFEDLIFITALAILAENMSQRNMKTKLKPVTAPLLQDALQNSNGILIYQEQLLEILQDIGSFSIQDAHMCRRILGRNKPEKKKLQEQFIGNVMKKYSISPENAQQLWSEIEESSIYTITKSIPAAEAMIIYKTASL